MYEKISDEQAGSKAIKSSHLGKQNFWVSAEKCEIEILIKKRSVQLSISRTQFSLTLALSSTDQKVEGLSLKQRVIGFDLRKQKSYGPGQMYAAFSRIKSYGNLCCIGGFTEICNIGK